MGFMVGVIPVELASTGLGALGAIDRADARPTGLVDFCYD